MTTKSAAPKIQYADSTVDGGFSHPILERIRKLLTSTDPEHWAIGGADLNHELRYIRPSKTYEQVLVRDIPNGSLVLHMTQPVECQYGPGGYTPLPAGAAHYSIEVRDRIFDAAKLVDPKYAANFSGKRCDVIASGDIAKSLYLQVKATITTVCKEKKRNFDAALHELFKDFPAVVQETPFDQWSKTSEVKEETKTTTYSTTTADGINISIVRECKGFDEKARAILTRDGFSNPHLPVGVARQCIKILEGLEQESQLVKLDGMLRDLGFE